MKQYKEVSYLKADEKVKLIIKKVCSYLKQIDSDFIEKELNKAYIFAKIAHEGQFRLSGEPYINHPVEATEILLSLNPDIYTIQACFLHDVIEDTSIKLEEIEKNFWKDVAFLCYWMEKLSSVRYTWEDRDIGSLRKMFIAMAQDLRVIFIKLSDRVHNMKTLKFHPKKEKQIKIANETLNIYSPIADRLGLFWIKNILEEECFKILNEKKYIKLKNELKVLNKWSKIFLSEAKKEINFLLKQVGIIDFKIDYRIKSIYSIYKKINKKWLKNAQSLYDIFGIRIIVNNMSDCYKTLWVIHNKWSPLPARFKDYIALPKPNWYKALHTTVVWLLKKNHKQPAEIQIKTHKMMEYAEIWVAAHFEYKEKWSKIAKDINWIKELKEITNNLENNNFISSLKIDVFNNRIFVFTPNWDSINLPNWSTVIDFAYELHSDLGDFIAIAKVNWKIYPLDKELKNWDRIEIIIDKKRKPNPFWLSFVKTNKAKNKIRLSLNKENKEEHRERWKNIMNKFLEKSWLWTFDKDLTLLRIIDWNNLKINDRWHLLEQVGNFSITPSNLMRRIIKTKNNWNFKKSVVKQKKEGCNKKNIAKTIIIWWEENLNYKIAKCCENTKLDKIVAHIKTWWIFSIHNRECETLKKVNKDRLLPAYLKWDQLNIISVTISFEIEEWIGILHLITEVLFNMKINIIVLNSIKNNKWNNELILTIEIKDYDYLLIDRLIDRIKLNVWKKILSTKIVQIKG